MNLRATNQYPITIVFFVYFDSFLGVWHTTGGKRRKNTQSKAYDEYHMSYCAIVGLMDHTFTHNDEERLLPPVPEMCSLLARDAAE